MPYRQPNSPFWSINKQYKGIGRIQKSTETTSKKVAGEMEGMLNTLYRSGKGVWLEELKAGRINLPTLYSKHLNGQLDTGISPVLAQPFDKIVEWVEDNPEYASSTKVSNRSLAAKLVRLYPGKALKDMPQILRDFRAYCLKPDVQITRGFNATRALLQAYATSVDGKYKPLWREITNIPLLKYDATTKRKLSYKEVRELTTKLIRNDLADVNQSYTYAHILWTLLLTGFRKSEYLGHWEVYEDRVKVICGKQRQTGIKERWVPIIRHHFDIERSPVLETALIHEFPYDPGTKFQAFERMLRKVSNRTVSPHTLRHTFRHWLGLAEIPYERCEYYMGHKPNLKDAGTVYSIYDDRSIVPHLKNDAEAMREWLIKQEYQYLAAHDEEWVAYDPSLAEQDKPPVPLMVKTPTKRMPRPSRKPQAVVA